MISIVAYVHLFKHTPLILFSVICLLEFLDLRSRLSEKKADQSTERQKKPVGKDSTKVSREQELDARIQRIKQQNEVILKRAKEIQAEKSKFS